MKKYNFAYMVTLYRVVLALLSVYAIYKYTIIPLTRNYLEINVAVMLLIAWLSPILVRKVKKKSIPYQEDTLQLKTVLYTLVLSSTTPIYFYILGITLLFILEHFLANKNTIQIIVPKLVVSLAMFLIGKYSFESLYMQQVATGYNMMDLLAGKATTLIGGCNTLLVGISYLILMQIPSYKKKIPLIEISEYLILLVAAAVISTSLKEEIVHCLNASYFMLIILVSVFPNVSPYGTKKQIAYAVIVGLVSFLLNRILPYEGTAMAILMSSLIFESFEKRMIPNNSF